MNSFNFTEEEEKDYLADFYRWQGIEPEEIEEPKEEKSIEQQAQDYRNQLLMEIELQKAQEEKLINELANQITPNTGVILVENVYLPIPTDNIHYKNPYKDLIHYTCISNFNEFDNKHNQERFIYKNKIIFKEVAKMLNVKKSDTISKNFKKLIDLGYIVESDINDKVYMIKYSQKGKGDYVTIHKDILQKLVDVFSNDAIAVYLYMCYRLREKPSILTREWICEATQMNLTKRNLDKVSSITETLENEGLIGKHIIREVRGGKPRDLVLYSLATHEEWKSGKYRHMKADRERAKSNKKSA